MNDRSGEGVSLRVPVGAIGVLLLSSLIVALLAVLYPATVLLIGRLLLTGFAGVLVVYLTVLAILGFRGAMYGPPAERHIWVQNAALSICLSAVVVAIWVL